MLPVQQMPFVGRQAELAEVATLLGNPNCRLLTLTGPGGIGKTRLAIEAARQTAFPNGAYFVALQALTSPSYIIPAVAEALNLTFFDALDPKIQLLNYLREKSLLLLLDNFEHLLEGSDLLLDLLSAAPDVKLLVTSRERLNLLEEWVLEVGGLGYPAAGAEDESDQYGAVELFLQHARRVSVGFQVQPAQRAAVMRICRLVGGMPLALELAATWVRALSCDAIAGEIARSLDILETPARNMQPRHRTMRAVFEQTWNSLSDMDKAVFRKLSVFRGGFTREAAEQVAGASLHTLTALVDKSLVRLAVGGRYEIHELLRQYGEAQLNQLEGEAVAVQDQHHSYYAGFAIQRIEHLKAGRQPEAIMQMAAEFENIRHAWRHASGHRKFDSLELFMESIFLFYSGVSWTAEAKEVFAELAAVLGANPVEEDSLFALSLIMKGWFTFRLGQFIESERILQQARAQLDQSHTKAANQGKVWGLLHAIMSFTTLALGAVEQAEHHCQQAAALFHVLQDPYYLSLLYFNWGRVAFAAEKPEEARNRLNESLTICRKTGLQAGSAYVLAELGAVAQAQGDYDQAQTSLEESLEFFREARDLWGLGTSLLRLGSVAIKREQFQAAEHYLFEALGELKKLWALPLILDALSEIALLLSRTGETGRAAEVLMLVINRPESYQQSRLRSEEYLAKIAPSVPPSIMAAIQKQAKAGQVDVLVEALLADYLQIEPQAVENENWQLVSPLTQRELEILRLIADGLSSREVAQRLFLSVETIRWYLKQIYEKLDAHSRVQAISRARSLKLLA